MTHASTLTSKGQITLPAELRRKYKLIPGQTVAIFSSNGGIMVKADDWQQRLQAAQSKVQAHLKKHGIKPLTDEQLDDAINTAAEQAALERYERYRKQYNP